MNVRKTTGGVVGLAVIILALPGWCAEKNRDRPAKGAKSQEVQIEPETVELFAAMNEGKITVAAVPQSYAVLTLRVRNNTQAPLKIELPATIAAVPTARLQAMQTGQAPWSLANSSGQGGSQGLGGSLSGSWSGNGLAQRRGTADNGAPVGGEQGDQQPAADGPGYWTLAPRQMFQTHIPTFCLEFGKPDPHSRIPYQLCPLNQLNGRPAVRELLDQFGKQGVNQCVAQLAAWHIASDVPWPMLSQVEFPRMPGSKSHRVTPVELMAARQLAESLPSYGQPASLSDQ